jgi:hypothetical protein
MASLIVSGAYAHSRAATPEINRCRTIHVWLPSLLVTMAGAPNRVRPDNERDEAPAQRDRPRTAQRQVVIDMYSCRSDALLYLSWWLKVALTRLRGNPR